jgi:hypothetical protein
MTVNPLKPAPAESHKSQAVANFMVPIMLAWLLAVGGLLSWSVSTADLLDGIGKVALFASVAVAFLTVVIAAIQDALPSTLKQWLLFPGKHPYPSYRAFEPDMLKKAEVTRESIPGIEGLGTDAGDDGNAEAQNSFWQEHYERHRGHAGAKHFSARHVAWMDTVPLVMLLMYATPILGRLANFSGGRLGWGLLTIAAAVLFVTSLLAARQMSVALVAYVVKLISQEKEKPESPAGEAHLIWRW